MELEFTNDLIPVQDAEPRMPLLNGQVSAIVNAEIQIENERYLQKRTLTEILSTHGMVTDSYDVFFHAPNRLYDTVRELFESLMAQKLLQKNEEHYKGVLDAKTSKALKKRVQRKFLAFIDDMFPGQRVKDVHPLRGSNNGMINGENMQVPTVEGNDEVECSDGGYMRLEKDLALLCDSAQVNTLNEQAGDAISERFFMLFKCYEKRLY